jgi:hypothetical protein
VRESSSGNVNAYGNGTQQKFPILKRPIRCTNRNPNTRTHRSTFGEEGASEGDEEAAATGAGAESESSAAGFPEAAREDADDVTRRDRRWIHEYDRGDEGALGAGAAEEEEVLDRRRAFITLPRPATTSSTNLPLIDYRVPELLVHPDCFPRQGDELPHPRRRWRAGRTLADAEHRAATGGGCGFSSLGRGS